MGRVKSRRYRWARGRRLFRSKVSARVFLLFVLCTLLPLGVLAFFTFDHLAAKLEEQALRELSRTGKAAAMAAFERLSYLDGELARVEEDFPAPSADPEKGPGAPQLQRLAQRFLGLQRRDGAGKLLFHWGRPFELPPLGGEIRGKGGSSDLALPDLTVMESGGQDHLVRGRTLLLNRGRELFFQRRMQDGSYLAAQIDPDWLWHRGSFTPLRQDLFFLIERKQQLIFTSRGVGTAQADTVEALARAGNLRSRQLTYRLEGEHLASLRFTPLKKWFGTDLVVVASQERAQVLAPLQGFRRIYMLVSVLAFILIVLVSLKQIRRTMVPIEELIDATGQVRDNNLGWRVDIHSGDEFEELGHSFNQMVISLEEAGEVRRRYEEELIRARDRALEAMRTESNFLSNVSHELRTPMTSIRSFAEILRDYADEDPETRREFLGIIVSESERLSRLIDDVLNLRKIQSGEENWNFELVRVEETLEEVYKAVSLGRTGNTVEVVLEIGDDLPPIWADRDRLKQVWTNLLSNALKFSPDDGTVHFRGRHVDGDILVSVRDEGQGIAQEDMKLIFERFKQASANVLTNKPKGTGLGLTIARDIVTRHGGTITVESVVGRGATFWVALPVLQGPEELQVVGGSAAGEGER